MKRKRRRHHHRSIPSVFKNTKSTQKHCITLFSLAFQKNPSLFTCTLPLTLLLLLLLLNNSIRRFWLIFRRRCCALDDRRHLACVLLLAVCPFSLQQRQTQTQTKRGWGGKIWCTHKEKTRLRRKTVGTALFFHTAIFQNNFHNEGPFSPTFSYEYFTLWTQISTPTMLVRHSPQ